MGKTISRLFVVAGAVGTLAAGWFAASAGAVLMRAPASPPVVAVAGAPDRAWIRLQDAALHCETRAVREGSTFVLGTDAAGRHPFLAQVMGEIPCKEIALEGSFLPGKYTRDFIRDRLRVQLPDGEDVRLFTEALTPRYQKAVLYRTIPYLAFAALLLALGIRGLRARA